MNDLTVSRSQILARVQVDSKDELLQKMVDSLAAEVPGLDPHTAYYRLQQREAQSPTVVGRGVAFPHALVPGLQRELLCVATLADPLTYGDPDDPKVWLVFMLLGPGDRPGSHLRALSAIARRCTDDTFLATAMEARTPEALWAVLEPLLAS
ncbi:MAG: hypothetical protein AMXMBFR64_14790 [Myxococcales bacterium]